MSVSTTQESLNEYVRKDKLGEGTYGVVYKCWHKISKQYVALKKIKIDPHEEGIPATTLREVSLLKELTHPCIIELKRSLYVDGNLFLVFTFVDNDLKQFLEAQRSILTLDKLRRLSFLLIEGVRYCHSNRTLHRDLKPQNILISKKGELKIADFGLGREHFLPIVKLTHEVVTLWYRPPEILLGSPTYGGSCDVWGIGTIIAEMATCRALFPGDSEIDQIFQIFKVLGTPNSQTWPGVDALPDWQTNTFPQWKRKDLARKLMENSHLDAAGCDLIEKMLVYQPSARITCREAKEHPWFDGYRDKWMAQLNEEMKTMATSGYSSPSAKEKIHSTAKAVFGRFSKSRRSSAKENMPVRGLKTPMDLED